MNKDKAPINVIEDGDYVRLENGHLYKVIHEMDIIDNKEVYTDLKLIGLTDKPAKYKSNLLEDVKEGITQIYKEFYGEFKCVWRNTKPNFKA